MRPGGREPRVVVLGASGFLGSALVDALAGTRVRLRAVSRREVRRPPAGCAGFTWHYADLAVPGAVADAVRDADIVFPFAARIRGRSGWRVSGNDVDAERINVGVVREVVAALAGRPGEPPIVVFPGSNTQLGRGTTERIYGNEPDRPEGPYDIQKCTAERLLKDATAAGDLRAVSLRLPPVFGPPAATADDRGIVSTMIRRALAGEPLTMWHDGTVRRDLLPVRDAARAFAMAAGHADDLMGNHFLVGSGRSRPLGDVFAAISRAVAAYTGQEPVPVVTVPPPAHAEDSDFRSVDIDPSAFGAVTGWRCRHSLEEELPGMVTALAARS